MELFFGFGGNFFLRDTAGDPRADKITPSGSQSQDLIHLFRSKKLTILYALYCYSSVTVKLNLN